MNPSELADITIRRAVPDDATDFARYMGDPAVYGGLMQMPYPSVSQWRERLSQVDPTGVTLVAVARSSVVGSGGLFGTAPTLRRAHARSLGLSVAREWQGRGIGSLLMQGLVEYADRWLGVLRIELCVYTDNAAAIALYRRFGFEIEGTFRAHALRDGAYVDSYAMARLHPTPPTLPIVTAA